MMTRLYAILATIGGAIAFLAMFWAKAQREQRKYDKAKANAARLKTIQQSKERQNEIENLSPDDRARRLDGLWSDDD